MSKNAEFIAWLKRAKALVEKGWTQDDWMDLCRVKLKEHIRKGDPRDVANYCAFLWHHKEHTAVYALQSVVITGRASDT